MKYKLNTFNIINIKYFSDSSDNLKKKILKQKLINYT